MLPQNWKFCYGSISNASWHKGKKVHMLLLRDIIVSVCKCVYIHTLPCRKRNRTVPSFNELFPTSHQGKNLIQETDTPPNSNPSQKKIKLLLNSSQMKLGCTCSSYERRNCRKEAVMTGATENESRNCEWALAIMCLRFPPISPKIKGKKVTKALVLGQQGAY